MTWSAQAGGWVSMARQISASAHAWWANRSRIREFIDLSSLECVSGERQNWPDFDRSVPRARDSGGDATGLLCVVGLHQIIARKLLLGLGERSVGGQRFSIPHTHRFGFRGGLQS